MNTSQGPVYAPLMISNQGGNGNGKSKSNGKSNGNGTQDPAEIAFQTLGEWLEEDGWHPDRIDERHAFRTGVEGDSGQMRCIAEVRVQQQLFLFYVLAPTKVPEGRRIAVAEAVARANWGLPIGNLELDFSDGEIRCKSSIDFEGGSLTTSLIRNAIYSAVETIDHYLPALMSVAHGGKEAAEAIDEVEALETED